jgi:hypothetical protein
MHGALRANATSLAVAAMVTWRWTSSTPDKREVLAKGNDAVDGRALFFGSMPSGASEDFQG